MQEIIKYTHDEFRGDLLSIVRQAEQDNFRPDFVAGIARGGLVPAVYLAQWFECPVITVRCSLRDNDEIDLSELYELGEKDKVLLVDDIIDSGDSFETIEKEFSNHTGMDIKDAIQLRTASLWYNLNQSYDADYIGREFQRKFERRWIVFPWEDFWK